MTYKEVTEGIDPIKKRIEQVRSRLNESKIQCVLTVNPGMFVLRSIIP